MTNDLLKSNTTNRRQYRKTRQAEFDIIDENYKLNHLR